MKTFLNPFASRTPTLASLVLLLAASLALLLPASLSGQTFTELHSFGTNTMGVNPYAGLLLGPDGMLYGTTESGGRAGFGQVFKVNPDGSDYTVLKDFTGTDGASPEVGLTLSGTTLYGTTGGGGTNGQGTVFKLNTDGSGFRVLKHFSGEDDGGYPYAELVTDGTTLYGTTSSGGVNSWGTVFKLNTDGSGFTVLKRFAEPEGVRPYGPLVLSGNTLYGTTFDGGTNAWGTVFSLHTDGTGFTILKHFAGVDGGMPCGPLVLDGTTLYGATQAGGTNDAGTVFKLNIDGSGFRLLWDFGDRSQGAGPESGLLLIGSVLYGVAVEGGSEDAGVVFRVDTNGANFAVLKDFSYSNQDGVGPHGGLAWVGPHLCGTVYQGGRYGFGTLFQVATNGSDFATLLDFAGGDGTDPEGPLLLAGETLFGLTANGGAASRGTLFAFDTHANAYTRLWDFTNALAGDTLAGGLVLAGSTLYGVACYGGQYEAGTLFALQTNGTGFTVLHQFDNTNGAIPASRLLLAGSLLYGTTTAGGAYGMGVLFALQTNGAAFTVLHHFDGTNGSVPNSSLVLSGDTLYGLTHYSRGLDSGSLFSLRTNGSAFTLLKRFGADEGAEPGGELLLAGDTLYGTAEFGGRSGDGTLFRFNIDGSGFAVLKSFESWPEGSQPSGQLALSGATLYGTTKFGGALGCGTGFCLQTNGTGFGVLRYFDEGSYSPKAVLPVGNVLYGTANCGGALFNGLLFRFSQGLPVIALQPDDAIVYPGNEAEFSAQVSGYPLPHCQWFGPTGALSAQTNRTLLLTNLQFRDAGSFYLVAANSYGSVTSRLASLTVLDPFVRFAPASTNVAVGQNGSFSVVAGGTGPFTYCWSKDGQLLAGATDSTLLLSHVRASDAGLYNVVISNACGSVQSASAWLTVNLAFPDAFDSPFAWMSVQALALQPDAKILVGGALFAPTDSSYTYLARLNPDGTRDPGFHPAVDQEVFALALQPDGKILFSAAANGSPDRAQLGRLNPDGTPDPSFTPSAFGVGTILLQPDGKILVAGSPTRPGPFMRLNPDGSPDPMFNSALPAGDTCCLALQPDGKILAGGIFYLPNRSEVAVLLRFNADGSLDPTFPRLIGPDWRCRGEALALQADGKILLGGTFGATGQAPGPVLLRLNPDGTLDDSFAVRLDNSPQHLLLQADGKLLVAGSFTSLNGAAVPYLGRLHPDGRLDPTFAPTPSAPSVNSLLFQPDGKLLVGGSFWAIAGHPSDGLARLEFFTAPQPGIWPPAQTAETGSAAHLVVRDSGYPAPAFQWYFGASALSGATNSTLCLANVSSAGAGLYSVVASNLVDCSTSAPAILSVIPAVEHRLASGLTVSGEVGSALVLESTEALGAAPTWVQQATLQLAHSPQWWFDAAAPLPPQRFYRASQLTPATPAPVLDLHMVPALAVPSALGPSLRLDYINQVGPTDAWVTLDTVSVTNAFQLYLDLSALGAPPRLYRWVPLP